MALTKVKAGNILLTTPAANSNDVTPATTQYVTTALANLADSAPATLNTLNELAAALGDDANFSTTVTNSIAAKLPLAGGTLTGNLLMRNGGNIEVGGYNSGNDKGIILTPSDSSSYWHIYNRAGGELTFGRNITLGSTEYMRIDSAGRVGIGTNNPSTPLHVVKVGNPNGGNRNTVEDALTLEATGYYPYTGYGIGINFQGEDYGNTAIRDYGKIQAVMEGNSDQNASGDPSFTSQLGFFTNSGGASSTVSSEKMTIKASGNVGIGTDNPSATDWGSASKVLQISGTQPLLSLKDTTGEFQIANSNQNLYFYDTAGSGEKTRIFIKADGNVGIGTTSPFGITTNRTCLSVNGTSSVSLNIGVGNAQKGYLYTDGNMTQLGSVGSIPLKFAPNDSPKMELFPSGELSMYGNKMVIDSDYSHWSGRYQHLTCHNAITSSNLWTDVAYVSYSPSLTIQGMAQRDNNGGYGASNFLGTVFGGYGATSVATERSQANPMNGGGFGALEYRYLNSGASSGSYRLQVRIAMGSGTMYITTTLTGQAFAEITED